MSEEFNDVPIEPSLIFGFATTTFFGVPQASYIAITDGINVCYHAGEEDIAIVPAEHIDFYDDGERGRMIPEYDEVVKRLIDYYYRWSSWSAV